MVSRNPRVAADWHDYRTLATAKIRSDWQYRSSFIILFIAQIVVTATDFLAIAFIFTNTQSLGGWTFAQVAFLYGIAVATFGLADFLVGSVENLSEKVKDGSFDTMLTRPVNALVNLTASHFGFRRLGRVVQALVILAVAVSVNDINWTLGRVAMLAVAFIAGTTIASCTWVLSSSIAFWTINTRELANTFTYGGGLAASYPAQIFENWLRSLVLYVIPLVFVAYLPSLYVLDIQSPLNLPTWFQFASPLVALAMLVVARMVWNAGIRRYQSTGT